MEEEEEGSGPARPAARRRPPDGAGRWRGLRRGPPGAGWLRGRPSGPARRGGGAGGGARPRCGATAARGGAAGSAGPTARPRPGHPPGTPGPAQPWPPWPPAPSPGIPWARTAPAPRRGHSPSPPSPAHGRPSPPPVRTPLGHPDPPGMDTPLVTPIPWLRTPWRSPRCPRRGHAGGHPLPPLFPEAEAPPCQPRASPTPGCRHLPWSPSLPPPCPWGQTPPRLCHPPTPALSSILHPCLAIPCRAPLPSLLPQPSLHPFPRNTPGFPPSLKARGLFAAGAGGFGGFAPSPVPLKSWQRLGHWVWSGTGEGRVWGESDSLLSIDPFCVWTWIFNPCYRVIL